MSDRSLRHCFYRFALLTALLAGCSSESDHGTSVGYVEAEWRYVAAPQSGWIVDQPAKEGDRVSVDDVLFVLDQAKEAAALSEAEARLRQARAESRNNATGAREPEIRRLTAQLAEARAQLEQASSERKRVLPLVEKGLEPSHRGEQVEASYQSALALVDAAEEAVAVAKLPAREGLVAAGSAAVEAAEAATASARLRLEERTIRVREAGRIEDVFIHEGELANAGQAVLAVLPEQGLMVRFFVNQQDLPSIKLGLRVAIHADGISAPIAAQVTRIAAEAEFTPPVIYSEEARGKLVFLVEARLPEGANVLPGLPVDVDWSESL